MNTIHTHTHRLVLSVLVLVLAAVSVSGPAIAATHGTVNVNQADTDSLALLRGVGPAVAQRIVEFRDENGDFSSVEELTLVRGIGERTLENLRPWISLEGATTLDEKVRRPRRTSDAESDD